MKQGWNLYTSLNATKSLDNVSIRLGVSHLNKVCHSENRFQFDNKDPIHVTWYNCTFVSKNKFIFGLLGAYGFANNVLVKNKTSLAPKSMTILQPSYTSRRTAIARLASTGATGATGLAISTTLNSTSSLSIRYQIRSPGRVYLIQGYSTPAALTSRTPSLPYSTMTAITS